MRACVRACVFIDMRRRKKSSDFLYEEVAGNSIGTSHLHILLGVGSPKLGVSCPHLPILLHVYRYGTETAEDM